MKKMYVMMCMLAVFAFSAVCFAAYHHEGEKDADKFLQVYPDKAGTKLDHCALCHSSGKYEKSEGSFVSLGSCQWCHYSYGYDGSGNILDTMNAYGKAYHDNGRNAAAISAIETADSDGDGFANKAEIDANTFPGNSEDDPSKKTAPFRVYTKAQLEAMPQHTQFLLMNTSKSGDFYAEYSGVAVEDLLLDAGISDSATGITVYAPDGWAQYHPLKYDAAPEMYHVFGAYPEASYQYDPEAESWCDYSAASCKGRKHNDIIAVSGGLKMLLAYKRDGAYLDAGVLSASNKLDGEGPYRVVVPQKTPGPPDQASNAANQNVKWPYNNEWDHNAGACTRSATIIKVEPLPEGTTDIDTLEAAWNYVDQGKIIVYGAIADSKSGGGYLAADGLWIKAVIHSEEKGDINAVWKKGGEDVTEAGDRAIWGHFYASPYQVTWGSSQNPDVFVKIWLDHSGRIDVNFFHVSVPDIEVYSVYPYNNNEGDAKNGTVTLKDRYLAYKYQKKR
jgi:hypothetical protein